MQKKTKHQYRFFSIEVRIFDCKWKEETMQQKK